MVKPGYKQTDLGLLPEEWACREIGSFADVCMCKRIFAEQTSEMGEIPFYKIGTFGKKADAYISRPLFEEYKQKYSYPQKGDVLISAAGTLGRTVVYDGEEAYFQDSNIVWLDIDKSQISNDYLYHYYKVIKWTPSEGSTIARLYNGIITSTNVAVPPKPEQEAIAEALTDIDTLIVNLEKLIAKKKAIKQGAMQELLTGRRRLPGFDGEWNTYRFGDIFAILPNNAFTRAEMSDSGVVKNIHYGDILTKYHEYISAESNEIPYIAPSVDLSRFSDKCFVKSGDIIIADTAEDETVGKALEVIMVYGLMLSGQHTMLCRPQIPFAERFLGYYLNATCYHEQLIPYITGTKVSSISKTSIAQTFLCVPSLQEQATIADILTDMDNEIAKLEENLAKYRLVKQGMMSELLTGRIRLL